MVAGAMRKNPMGSSWFICSNKVFAGLREGMRLGVAMTRATSETAPTGTLIQKHHRQVMAVKYPPRIGPSIDASPNMEPSPPEYLGRERRGTKVFIKTKPPEDIPAPPIPVIALPATRTFGFRAKADRMEPISNISTSAVSAATGSADWMLFSCQYHYSPHLVE